MSTIRFLLLTTLLFTALTAVMTYPQVLHMRDAVHDDGDPLLNAWTLAWVAHQLPRAPGHLFDANIFYPERGTLAFSETLLAPAVVAAPLRWVGAGPILVHNVVLLSGFVLSGVGMALLARTLTGCTSASVLAGLVFAFLPYRIGHYAHLQLQQTECLPLVFWSFHRLLRTGRFRDGAWLGVFTAGQVLSCVYYGLFLIPYIAIVGGVVIAHRNRVGPGIDHPRRPGLSRIAAALAVAAAIATIVAFPLAGAYLDARRVVGDRAQTEVMDGSATWRNYLGAPPENAVYGRLLARFGGPERQLFPGFIAIALAVLALIPLGRRSTPIERWAYLIGLVFAIDASLGFNGLSYPVLYDWVVPFRALRIPARIGMFVGFSLAVLTAYGAARVLEHIESIAIRRAAAILIATLILTECASRPIPLQPIPRPVPEVYADLVRDGSRDAAIVEYPMSHKDDPTYMYYSTFHWRPLVNGYSGFFPPSYSQMVASLASFPDQESIDAITSHGVRYLLVHEERMIGKRYSRVLAELDRRTDLALISRRAGERYGQHGEISLYRVVNARPFADGH